MRLPACVCVWGGCRSGKLLGKELSPFMAVGEMDIKATCAMSVGWGVGSGAGSPYSPSIYTPTPPKHTGERAKRHSYTSVCSRVVSVVMFGSDLTFPFPLPHPQPSECPLREPKPCDVRKKQTNKQQTQNTEVASEAALQITPVSISVVNSAVVFPKQTRTTNTR